MYKFLIRPFLFLWDPEKVHHFTFCTVKFLSRIGFSEIWKAIYGVENTALERQVFGLTFKNPVGLAAGFDKDAKLYNELSDFGFGFIEIGTLTPKAQPGNPKKRLFRLREDRAIINRMGFNNEGVDKAVERLRKKHPKVLIGGNIGKNKTTPNEDAVADYLYCFNRLFEVVDYFVVNVSSPNTPHLRALQGKEPLTQILQTLQQENEKKPVSKPILLKIAPDLTNEQLLDIISIVKDSRISGVIATNTTLSRDGLHSKNQKQTGGLSGKPLRRRSLDVIQFLSEKSESAFPIIGVGGIFSADDAIATLNAGASLVQIYTGFIYEGPGLIKKINRAILKRSA